MRHLKRLLAVLLVFALAGTIAFFALVDHLPLATPARARAAVPPEVEARFACDPAFPVAITLGAEVARAGHRMLPGTVRLRRAEAGAEAFESRFELWLADGVAGPAPALVVTPILGGGWEVEEIIADDLASHGMHALIVDRHLPGDATFAGLEGALRDMVAMRRRMIDWLEARPDVDARRIGAYGVSLGGITTAMLAAVEPRVRASVVVMAGGDFANVLSRSIEGEAARLREVEMFHRAAPPPESEVPGQEAPGAAAMADFLARGRATLLTCPLALARYADPASMVLFTTRRDTSVPTDCQLALRDALGGPEAFSLPTGHYSAVIYLKLIESRARAFLERRFAGAAAGAPGPRPAG